MTTAQNQQHKLFSALEAGARVDAEAGILFGVAVITEGPARGHSAFDEGTQQFVPVMVDGETLRQVAACAQEYAGGLKVKMNHHGGAEDIVGVLRGFAVDGNKLRADLHLLRSSPHRAYVLEVAQTAPEAFGLSISFSGKSEIKDGRALARCSEIYSADLVDEPAANPDGLFDAATNGKGASPRGIAPTVQHPTKDTHMTPEEIKALNDKVAKLEALLNTQATELTNFKSEQPKLVAEQAEKMAFGIIQKFVAQFGAPESGKSAAPSATVETKKEEKPERFEDKVAKLYEAQPAEKRSKMSAIKQAAREFPQLHAEYRKRCEAGEVITL